MSLKRLWLSSNGYCVIDGYYLDIESQLCRRLMPKSYNVSLKYATNKVDCHIDDCENGKYNKA